MSDNKKEEIFASKDGPYIISGLSKVHCQATGHRSVHDLSIRDLVTVSSEISGYTNIEHV